MGEGSGKRGKEWWKMQVHLQGNTLFTWKRNTQLLDLQEENCSLTTFKNWQPRSYQDSHQGQECSNHSTNWNPVPLFPTFCDGEATKSTPTISLMADQVKSLMKQGVSAAPLGGGKKDFKVVLAFSLGSSEFFSWHQRSFLCWMVSHISILSLWHLLADWPACNWWSVPSDELVFIQVSLEMF